MKCWNRKYNIYIQKIYKFSRLYEEAIRMDYMHTKSYLHFIEKCPKSSQAAGLKASMTFVPLMDFLAQIYILKSLYSSLLFNFALVIQTLCAICAFCK